MTSGVDWPPRSLSWKRRIFCMWSIMPGAKAGTSPRPPEFSATTECDVVTSSKAAAEAENLRTLAAWRVSLYRRFFMMLLRERLERATSRAPRCRPSPHARLVGARTTHLPCSLRKFRRRLRQWIEAAGRRVTDDIEFDIAEVQRRIATIGRPRCVVADDRRGGHACRTR